MSALHVSFVQMSVSAQFFCVPMHSPSTQVSASVQGLSSLHSHAPALSTGVLTQPSSGSHTSVVHSLPSSH